MSASDKYPIRGKNSVKLLGHINNSVIIQKIFSITMSITFRTHRQADEGRARNLRGFPVCEKSGIRKKNRSKELYSVTFGGRASLLKTTTPSIPGKLREMYTVTCYKMRSFVSESTSVPDSSTNSQGKVSQSTTNSCHPLFTSPVPAPINGSYDIWSRNSNGIAYNRIEQWPWKG